MKALVLATALAAAPALATTPAPASTATALAKPAQALATSSATASAAPALATTPAQAFKTSSGKTVKVYFSADFDVPGKVVAVTRKAPNSAVGTFAIQQLIKGPTKTERKRGLHSELGPQIRGKSDCGADFKLSISKGTATLRFCRTVFGLGVGGDARILHTIDRTLRQFGTVKKVITLDKDGRCLFDQTTNGTSCITGHE
ncbi:GerMN domain-containing protein [Nonomuraea sp. NPDC059194]|uniref:GerMN domain-containing protein n=1 Tax=Nonomuraea sp. NPDC059194 TaxID=3346764 RepID=UPI0036C49A77